MSHIAIGSRMIKRGVDKPGSNHFRKAPSKSNKKKYIQMPVFKKVLARLVLLNFKMDLLLLSILFIE